ncbi:MAG: pentapeptide repeat-containing protein [Bacilli bacterium]|nr:pentapeptide repeat-containing protein [Bacilli bacterium]
MQLINDNALVINELKKFSIDCTQCNGLCCSALFFTKSDGFPQNKKAGIPCMYLQDDYRCEVYSEHKKCKLKGCMTYDCFNAGVLVSKRYANQNELRKQEIVQQMYDLYLIVFNLQQMRFYLIEALLHLSKLQDKEACSKLIEENEWIIHRTVTEILSFDLQDYHQRVNIILKKLCSSNHAQTNQLAKKYRGQNLNNKDFSMCLLIGSDLSFASLDNANFLGSDVRDVNVRDTDLSKALFLTQMQLNGMIGNRNTKIPAWLI